MKTGQTLYKKAKTLIPGGTMLLSKRPEMFLPDLWPAYFSKAKGCEVWDLDNNKYIDMSIMGIGTNILGYGNDEVDEAVKQTVVNGNMSTLNCPEEVYLAEKLVTDICPWADMVRFARTGGEANAMAIRIARAASNKDKVAICGYHGWHDWYLATNLGNNQGLKEHLLPGLEPNGVPQDLKGNTLPFLFNDFDEITNLVENHDIGVIKMEVQRNTPPKEGYLEHVRALANKHNIVLIFDECTSGFRTNLGPIFNQYKVIPDMTVLGKTMANGYAMTAVIGTQAVMEAAQSTFISSTFWTERIGPTAALKAIEVMECIKPWDALTDNGNYMSATWQKLADKYELPISRFGISALSGFSFNADDALKYKTYLTQESLKQGFLGSTVFYACTAHNRTLIDEYAQVLDGIFAIIAQCEFDNRNIDSLLEGKPCHGGFKRLN